MKVSFCRSCGRVTLAGFLYCPYCGVALRPGAGLHEACEALDRMEPARAEAVRNQRIDSLLEALEELEIDVDTMLEARPVGP